MNRPRLSRPVFCSAPGSAWRCGILLFLGVSLLPGCLLLNWSSSWLTPERAPGSGEGSFKGLGKIPTSRTTVTLEIVFVERTVNDPLLGPQLWSEVDQISSLPPAERKALANAGFRVGRVGANPPQALQTLLGLATDLGEADEKRLVGRRVVLPSGAETEINTGLAHPQITIKLPLSEGSEPKTFEDARGVFRVKAKQLQAGWARIEFLPEIHHGQLSNRPIAFQGDWQYKTAQEVERLYRQKFFLDLNLGEMVILSGEVNLKDSLGHHFFHSPDFSGPSSESTENATSDPASKAVPPGIQRLLVVRLADLDTVEPLYSEQ